MPEYEFDVSRARLRGPDHFERLRVAGPGEPISAVTWPSRAHVAVIERGGESLALHVRHLATHHVAQGELAGEPYVISF